MAQLLLDVYGDAAPWRHYGPARGQFLPAGFEHGDEVGDVLGEGAPGRFRLILRPGVGRQDGALLYADFRVFGALFGDGQGRGQHGDQQGRQLVAPGIRIGAAVAMFAAMGEMAGVFGVFELFVHFNLGA